MATRKVLAGRLPSSWPLVVIVAGFPLWWALGLAAFMPLLMTIPMAMQLARRREVRYPAGFPAWIFFVGVVLVSATMLWVDAPLAVPGGGFGRLMVYSFRLVWCLACGVVLLWVCNTDRRDLSDRRVVRLMSWMFVITAVGGLLGVLAPTFEFKSLMEIVLPGGLAGNGFIRPLIHPSAASIQTMMGEEAARPMAPFEFANSWGANLSMYLPFFVLGWFGKDAGWRRGVAPVVLLLAAVPTVASLNRGLWASLAAGGLFIVVRLALKGRVIPLVGVVLAAMVVGAAFLASPLAETSTSRLENPHSNDRRGQLLTQTVESMAEGSPVIGFGSTRDVQGSFASIAGGSTPDCHACSVPPLGTQGFLWLLLFAFGIVGTGSFLAFFVTQGAHHWRCRTALEVVGMCLMLFSAIQMLVYDILGLPLYTLMIGTALMWRERADDPLRTTDGNTLGELVAAARRQWTVVAVFVVLGAIGGGIVSLFMAQSVTSTVPVLLAPAPVHLRFREERESKPITIDTEAAMVYSEKAIERVRSELGLGPDVDLRDSIRVTAVPTTSVMLLHVTDDDPVVANAIAGALADAYLDVRREYLEQRRLQVLANLQAQLASVEGLGPLAEPFEDESGAGAEMLAEDQIRSAIDTLLATPADPGSVLRVASAKADRVQREVPFMSGVVLGALLGSVVAAARENRRRRSDAAGYLDAASPTRLREPAVTSLP